MVFCISCKQVHFELSSGIVDEDRLTWSRQQRRNSQAPGQIRKLDWKIIRNPYSLNQTRNFGIAKKREETGFWKYRYTWPWINQQVWSTYQCPHINSYAVKEAFLFGLIFRIWSSDRSSDAHAWWDYNTSHAAMNNDSSHDNQQLQNFESIASYGP